MGASFDLSYTLLYENLGISKNNGTFLFKSVWALDFKISPLQACLQNLSMAELVDWSYDGQHVMAGCTQFITRQSTVTL